MEEKIKEYMKKYSCSEEEAKEIIAWDSDDTMETEETKKASDDYKKFSRTLHDAHSNEKKPRKPREIALNPTKVEVIKAISDSLIELGFEDVTITNAQKFIVFKKGDDVYELNLCKKTAKGLKAMEKAQAKA